MATKSERDLEAELGPSPNPFFAKKNEPWEDPKLMLKLDKRHEYQYEIAHVLGASPSQISYWMDKAYEYDESQFEEAAEQGETKQCIHHEVCGNELTVGRNEVCPQCLDLVRHNDSATGQTIDPADSDSLAEHMSELYGEYQS